MDITEIQKNLDKLKVLQLFVGINEVILGNIFSNSKLLRLKKGETLFLQDEQADHVYIIIEGSIKIFKSNEEGEEMLLKVVKVGNSFLEAITFSCKKYTTNAQSLEDILILSIPVKILNQNIQKDNRLATNMLTIVGNSSQTLIAKIEQLTLKTSVQRIGWFLLRLFIEKKGKDKTIELPYDKSLIASYLNMKPETFSRSIKQLKEQGIDIAHNTISIKDDFALCEYCNSYVASKCPNIIHQDCRHNN